MLAQVLGVQPDDLTITAIAALIANRTPESQRLEFKSELPGNQPDSRREFARDVAAMANGGGGVIVLGVRDENDVPVEITPVALGPEVTRLQQICATSIEPYHPVTVHELRVHDDGGVIIIELLPSSRRPFAVIEGSRFSFYERVGRHKHPLSEADIERLYRDRFRRQGDIRERLAELSARATEPVSGEPLPRAFVAAVPELLRERMFRPDRRTTQALRDLRVAPIFYAPNANTIPTMARPGFKRLELANSFAGASLERWGWIEIHDDGAFLGTIAGQVQTPTAELTLKPLFYDIMFVARVLTRLATYWTLARHFDLYGEVVLQAGITANRLPVRMSVSDYRSPVDTARDLAEPVSTQFSADLAALEPGPALLRTAKVLLDDLFTAFGWPECLQLSSAGDIRRRYFDDDWIPGLERWAAETQTPITGSVDE